MNYYKEIKNKLIDNEIYAKVKDYSKERYRVITYFEVGKLLSDAGKHYGEDVIGKYSLNWWMKLGKYIIKKCYLRCDNYIYCWAMKKSHHWCDN